MDEAQRLATLRSLRAIGAPPGPAIEGAVRLAAHLMDCPIGLVTLIEDEIQWVKAVCGVDVCSMPRKDSFCVHALELPAHAVMVVEDATQDPRFVDNPNVTGSMNVRFYAGALLTASDGASLGALCVIDTKPRPRPNETLLDRLRDLARLVVGELERARADRLQRENQHMLAMVEGLSGVGHWRVDMMDQKVVWSDEVYAIHGLTRETYSPTFESALNFYPEADRAILSQHCERTMAGEGAFSVELSITRADGVKRRVVAKGAAELSLDGRSPAMFGVFQDVTDQREAMAVMERSRGRYKLLADHAADVIARVQLDGSSNYISPAIERLLGWTPTEMAGRSAAAFVHPEDRAQLDETFAEMGRGLDSATLEHRLLHRDGREVWGETRMQLIRDDAGRPVETVVVIRDISRRKSLETQLQLARAEAEAAATVKSEFLANMSHELRTPLTSIIGFTGLALEQDLPDAARSYIGRVDNAGRALLCTVNDILDFSKLEAGQVVIRPQPMDVVALSAATLELFTPQAGAKDLALTLDADPAPPVVADADRLRQIMLNLVGNAVKFTATGEVRLEVRWSPESERLRVAVHDTGAGIPADKLDRLFRRFSQVDGAQNKAVGGTGLGLAICKGLAEAMGGAIGAESVEGQGSVFWFDIPAPRAEREVAPATTPMAAAEVGGLKVLIADDHPANRELARAFLSGMGVEVEDAVDGLAAVECAGRTTYDVILMDMRMPGLGGREALKAIREGAGPNRLTPILAYTADAGEGLEADLRAEGFCGAVSKPVAAEALIRAVAEALQTKDFTA
ncbi:ATP-binding protein [Brevundimonas sp. M20]|uniref:ATP-binding protein n=1 Tax=Brevundimonas sp. M20 TaxID=2591463 RepID=UPI00114769E3|nr:ATP-binding protein [Brevundimonas sp. M20]QDH73591.1 PAS domain S-box protein [Brevundimonas sp. M20]